MNYLGSAENVRLLYNGSFIHFYTHLKLNKLKLDIKLPYEKNIKIQEEAILDYID